MQYYRPLYNVEQVEILRGPNALFFGRGGAGGVLNRVTKKGQIGENFNAFSGNIDTFGGAIAEIDSNVTVSEKAAVRINAYYESYDSDRDFADGGDGYGVNPTATFKLGDATTLNVSYERLDYDRFIDRGIPTGTDGEPIGAFDNVFFGDPDVNESNFEADIIRGSLEHNFTEEIKGRFDIVYGDYDKAYANYYATTYDQAADPDNVTLAGYVDTTDRESLTLSSTLISEFETLGFEHTFVVGAEYIHTENDNTRMKAPDTTVAIADLKSFSSSFTVFGDDTEVTVDTASLYFQDEIELFEQLTVVLGGRFDSFDIDFTDNAPAGSDDSQKDEEFTPRVGVVYKPAEDISIYASYSETFVPQSGEQYPNLGDARDLDPNEYINLEAGVKWDFAEGYSFTAAIFEIDQDVVEETSTDVFERVDNEIKGFEAQFSGQITDAWFVTAGYSYLEGDLDQGGEPRELPENMLSVWNYYRVSEKFALGLGAIYQDESQIKNGEGGPMLPDFWRVDAAAYYQINDDFRLQVNVENLLDEEYYPSAHSTHQATVGEPIHATFKIVGRF